MKKFLRIGNKLLIVVFCTAICSLSSYAQKPGSEAAIKAEYEQKVAEQLAKYELKGVKTSLLLNKGVFTTDEVEYYRHLPRNNKGQIVTPTSAEDWQNLYERLVGADLREKARFPASRRVPNSFRLF